MCILNMPMDHSVFSKETLNYMNYLIYLIKSTSFKMLLSLIDFVSSYLEGTEHKSHINLTGFQTNS